jgi:hypothetical protein
VVIYDLTVWDQGAGVVEWSLAGSEQVRYRGRANDLPSALLMARERSLVARDDELKVTWDGYAVGVYPVARIEDDASAVVSDIAAARTREARAR